MRTMLIAAAAAVLVAPGIASAQELTGNWKFDLDISGMKFHATCQMTQMGAALSGMCTGTDTDPKPVPVTGSVDGATAKFAYDVNYQGSPLHVAYTGTVKSDTTMDGTVDAQIAQGTFTGVKQAAGNSGTSAPSP